MKNLWWNSKIGAIFSYWKKTVKTKSAQNSSPTLIFKNNKNPPSLTKRMNWVPLLSLLSNLSGSWSQKMAVISCRTAETLLRSSNTTFSGTTWKWAKTVSTPEFRIWGLSKKDSAPNWTPSTKKQWSVSIPPSWKTCSLRLRSNTPSCTVSKIPNKLSFRPSWAIGTRCLWRIIRLEAPQARWSTLS